MTVQLLRYANREKVAQALTDGGYRVSRNTVNRWARGDEMPDIARRMILRLFGHEEERVPRPGWAEGLEQRIVSGVVDALPPDRLAEVEHLIVGLERSLRLGVEAPRAKSGEADQDA